uniref:Secreted protein n=1 Tax=Steinernema glaseri TaxID=37863 RepID=A0A1I7YNP7_9BILA
MNSRVLFAFFVVVFLTSSSTGQYVYQAPVVTPYAGYNAYLPGYYNYLSYPYYGMPYAYAIGSNKGGSEGPSRPGPMPKLANEQ